MITKEKLYEQGYRADLEQGNHLYYCDHCKKITRSKQWDSSLYNCCGDTTDYHYIAHLEAAVNPPTKEQKVKLDICHDDPVLKQARTECKSKLSKLQRHLYFCDSCHKVHTQTNYEPSLPCDCGNTLMLKYTYIAGKEYFSYGEATGQQISVDNFVKQVRKSLGLSQKMLAKLLGVNQQFMSAMEQGTKQIPQHVTSKLTDMYFE